MKGIKIDFNTWHRTETFRHFTNDINCVICLTADVDVTELVARCKQDGLRFFPGFMYVVARAVNDRQELRMGYDEDGDVTIWDVVHPSYIDFHAEDEGITRLVSHYSPSFDTFYRTVVEDMETHREERGFKIPYDCRNFFDVSSLPWLSYNYSNRVECKTPRGFYVPSVLPGPGYPFDLNVRRRRHPLYQIALKVEGAAGMQLEDGGGDAGGDGPGLEDGAHRLTLFRPTRQQDDLAGAHDAADAHGEGPARHGVFIGEILLVAGDGLIGEPDKVVFIMENIIGLVEADVPVGADAEQLQVGAVAGCEGVEAGQLRLGRGVALGDDEAALGHAHSIEKIFAHVVVVGVGVITGQPLIFVKVDDAGGRKIGLAGHVVLHQPLVDGQGSGPGGQPQQHIFFAGEGGGDVFGGAGGAVLIAGGDDQFQCESPFQGAPALRTQTLYDFSRVEDVPRVEHYFDLPHQPQRFGIHVPVQVGPLGPADAVLARHQAVQLVGPLVEPGENFL